MKTVYLVEGQVAAWGMWDGNVHHEIKQTTLFNLLKTYGIKQTIKMFRHKVCSFNFYDAMNAACKADAEAWAIKMKRYAQAESEFLKHTK